ECCQSTRSDLASVVLNGRELCKQKCHRRIAFDTLILPWGLSQPSLSCCSSLAYIRSRCSVVNHTSLLQAGKGRYRYPAWGAGAALAPPEKHICVSCWRRSRQHDTQIWLQERLRPSLPTPVSLLQGS